jgi:hypothetical protein
VKAASGSLGSQSDFAACWANHRSQFANDGSFHEVPQDQRLGRYSPLTTFDQPAAKAPPREHQAVVSPQCPMPHVAPTSVVRRNRTLQVILLTLNADWHCGFLIFGNGFFYLENI